MNQIKSFAGTSAGASIGVLLCAGAPIDGVLTLFKSGLADNPFSDSALAMILNLFRGYGLYTFDKFNKMFDAFVEPLGVTRSTTFRELWLKTQKDLFITGTNVTKRRLEIFSHYTTPDMSVLVAMQISMSAAPFFTCTTYNGDIYADGAYTLDYPINIFLEPQMIFENYYQLRTLNVDYVNLNNPKSDNHKLFPELKYKYTYSNSIQKQPEEVLGICICQILYKGGFSFFALLANLICLAFKNNLVTISRACFTRTICINNTLNHPSFDFSVDAFKYFRQLGDKTYDDYMKKDPNTIHQ
jgi:predicted acylesterase/phospholipase RssA